MAKKVDNLTNFSDQVFNLQLPDGTLIAVELIYAATAERWVMNLSYGDRTINGLGICCDPNILRQWRNVLPFGMACTTDDQTDPFALTDFSSSRASLFLLDTDEVAQIESQIFDGVAS